MANHSTVHLLSQITVGTDPVWEERILRRVVRIGAGKIFGSRAFVEAVVCANGRALPRGARAWAIFEGAFAEYDIKPTVYSGFCPNDPLQPSGLLGPVTLVFVQDVRNFSAPSER